MTASLVEGDARPLSAAQLDFFTHNGYLELENILDQSQARALAESLLQLVRAQGCPGIDLPDFSGWSLERLEGILLDSLLSLERADHKYISNIYDTIRDSAALYRIVSSPGLCDAAAQLMGLARNSPLYLLQHSCRIDMPRDQAFALDWHQEVHYTFKDSELIQLWAPAISDIGLESGALRILPGSQKAGVAATRDRVPEFGHAQYVVEPSVVARFQEKAVTMRRGNALLFNRMLIHKSGINSSARPRLTLITHYHNAARPGFFANLSSPAKDKNPYQKP